MKKDNITSKSKSIGNKKPKESKIESKLQDPKIESKIAINSKDSPDSEKKIELDLTESKISKLLDIGHIDELFYLSNILNEKQIASFIGHYKESKIIPSNDKKIDQIVKSSKNPAEFIALLKKELINTLKEDYSKIREEISKQRKKGVDTYIEDVKSMSIPLKIKLFEATSDKQDFYKIKKIITEIKEILEENKNKSLVNQNKEIIQETKK